MELLKIPCRDGVDLGGWLIPAKGPEKGVVQINPATAVVSRLYRPFAEYLSSEGWDVVCYDYRGTGASKDPALRPREIGFTTWAEYDVSDVTCYVNQRFFGLPHLAVGHSFGGHAFGFSDATNLLDGAVLVAAHVGCYRHVRGLFERLRVWFLLKLALPAAGLFVDTIPSRQFGVGDDLPAGVAFEWSRWTSMENYFFDDEALRLKERFASVRVPLLSIGIDDDPWAPPHAVDALAAHFTGTTVERWQRGPAHSHGRPVGHIGFFRRAHRDTFWPELERWLSERVSCPHAIAASSISSSAHSAM